MSAGTGLWLLLDLLGVPEVFGIGSEAGLIPLAIAGGILGITRARLLMPVSVAALFALVAVVSYTPLIVQPARSFVRVDPVPASADAVVVLSAGVTADGYLTQQGTDRVVRALELMEARVAPVLVFTREEKGTGLRRYDSSRDQQRFAAIARVGETVVTAKVESTHDEALAVARIAKARKWQRIILVTSPFHSRRACATFEKAGLAVSCVPSDSRDIAVRRLDYPHDRIGAFAMWLYETAGTLRYRQLGWI